MSFPIAALAGGGLIFIVVIGALLFAVVFGYYTYRGSAINPHLSDGMDGAPGSAPVLTRRRAKAARVRTTRRVQHRRRLLEPRHEVARKHASPPSDPTTREPENHMAEADTILERTRPADVAPCGAGDAEGLRSSRERPRGSMIRPAASRGSALRALALASMLLLVIALAGCGNTSSSAGGSSGNAPAHVHFAKTKFLLHAGLAFGAFHRYIYKPFRSGGFTPPLRHKLAIAKAGAAALFAYHEIKIALIDAQSSALLSKLVSPLTALRTRLSSLGQHLHSGQLNPSAINGANGAVSKIGSLGASSGASIHDLATSSLGG